MFNFSFKERDSLGSHISKNKIEFEFIGVLRHMHWYFSYICDGTDVKADWRSCTYGRAPNAIVISQGSLTCPSNTDTGPPFLYGDSDTPPHWVAFYDTLGIRRTYSWLKPPASARGKKCFVFGQSLMIKDLHRFINILLSNVMELFKIQREGVWA